MTSEINFFSLTVLYHLINNIPEFFLHGRQFTHAVATFLSLSGEHVNLCKVSLAAGVWQTGCLISCFEYGLYHSSIAHHCFLQLRANRRTRAF
jgi:hypothetical protein